MSAKQQSAGANAPAGLLSIDTLQKAAAALRGFEPARLNLPHGNVEVGKLPGLEFAEGLARFSGQIVPLLREFLDEDNKLRREFDIGMITEELVTQVAQTAPEAVLWLAQHATRKDGALLASLEGFDWDECLLLAAACIKCNFIDHAAVRVFSGGVISGSRSVSAEIAAAQPPTPPTGEPS